MANIHRIDLAMETTRLSAARIVGLVLCMLVAVVDGFDFVSIGVVAPLMMPALGLSAAQLGVILALTQIGAAVGALSLGRAADRYGRRPLIIVALSLIALFTLLTPFARTPTEMMFVRFLTGIALAGAIPATLALVAELAPRRMRTTLLSLVVAGFPLGAAFGSLVGGPFAEREGWQAIFFLGATLSASLTLVVWLFLPESPRYLALHDNRGLAMRKTMARLVPTVDAATLWQPIARNERLPEGDEGRHNVTKSGLLSPGLARPTLMLWAMLFCSGALSNVTLVWIPTILTTVGISIGLASSVVGSINIGATLGMALAGRILEFIGARVTVGLAYAACTAATVLIGTVPTGTWLIVVAGILGFFLGITTSAGYSLSAIIYPASIRSTGVGAAAAALRIGTISAPIAVPVILGFELTLALTFAVIAIIPMLALVIAVRFKK